jgi:hypothetical protein
VEKITSHISGISPGLKNFASFHRRSFKRSVE